MSACARDAPRPVKHEGTDFRLPAEVETIESRVPAHATLDGLLRDNRLQESLVIRAVEAARGVFNPRQLRPTGRTVWSGRSTGCCASSSIRSTRTAS